jgi:hypothetical protein
MSRAPKVTKTQLNVQPPARNYVDNVSMTYGDKTKIKNELADTPEFKNEIVSQLPPVQDITAQAQFRNRMLPEDLAVFDATRKKQEPVTAGLPFGAGVGPAQPVQTAEQFIEEIIAITGDESLARLIR